MSYGLRVMREERLIERCLLRLCQMPVSRISLAHNQPLITHNSTTPHFSVSLRIKALSLSFVLVTNSWLGGLLAGLDQLRTR